jgi:kumamolisin
MVIMTGTSATDNEPLDEYGVTPLNGQVIMSPTAAQPSAGRFLPAPRPCADGNVGFDPRDMASYYAFPDGFDGTGTRISFVSLSGAVRRQDTDTYFSVMAGTAPEIEVVALEGSAANPAVDAELTLGVELAGAVAPGAKIAVYLASNTVDGAVDGLREAIFDSDRPADVVCLTWTIDEASLDPPAARLLDETMREATAMGLLICAPAGVWAAGNLQATFPGTHPSVLACGATRAVLQSGGLTEQPNGAARAPATSSLWRMEPWRARALGKTRARVSYRPVPDVSALAGGDVGYRVCLNGNWTSLTGPAAAASLWAGLLARLRQAQGRPWNMASSLYQTLGPASCLSPVPAAQAATGKKPAWDSRVGWGSPDGQRILAALSRK